MEGFFQVFTPDEILFALACAFILTSLINKLLKNVKVVGISGDIKINYNSNNFKSVLKSCYDLFPKDIITFGGDTFKRGMVVQVITSSNRIITGQLVGLNNDNMICLITTKYIVAHELSQILAITCLEKDSNI